MHNAGLYLGIDHPDRFGEAAQTVDDGNQDILIAAVLHFVEDFELGLGTFGLLDFRIQRLLAAVGTNVQRQVYRFVPGHTFVVNLQVQRIEIYDWVRRFERPLLRLFDFGQHFVGNGRD